MRLQLKTFFFICPQIVGFTSLGSRISAEELCSFLHDLFSRFDDLAISLGVTKIETVGYVSFSGV